MTVGTRDARSAGVVACIVLGTILALLAGGCASSGSNALENQTQQTTTGGTPQIPVTKTRPTSPTWPTPEAVQAVLKPWLGPGTVTVDMENSSDEQRIYILPPGSFRAGAEDDPNVSIGAYRYADDRRFTSGIYDVERQFGGVTPAEVYASSVVMIRDVGAAAGWGEGLREYPEGAGGTVTNEMNKAVVAGSKDYWYEVDITGVKGDAEFDDALVGLGRLLTQ